MLKKLLILLAVVFSPAVSLASTLKVVTESLPPRQMLVDGELTGFAVEVVRATFEEAQLPLEIQMLPWARAYSIVSERKNTLIFSIARTRSRESRFEWIGTIGQLNHHVYKLASREDIVLNSLSELPKYRILADRKSVLHEYLLQSGVPGQNIIHAELSSGILMMERGRVDLVFGDETHFPYYQAAEGRSLSNFKKLLPVPSMSVPLEMAMSKGSDPDLVERLRQALKAVKRDGRYLMIKDKYL